MRRMKLLVVNPNSTSTMTNLIGEAAEASASPGTRIEATNPEDAPASIEGYFDEALCVPGIIRIVSDRLDFDAVVIACFDDTGLDAVRCLTSAPVIGIGEAAFHAASMIANRFSVITTLSRSVPAIEHNLGKYGLAARCGKVRASDIPVLDLEDPASGAQTRIGQEIEQAKAADGAEAIVLGCAGMANFAAALEREHGLPVLDGVACAVAFAEALIRIGCRTSKIGGYSYPRKK